MLASVRRAGTHGLASLFPPRSTSDQRNRPYATAGAVVLAVFALVFSVVRQPGSALDNPWAEDGTIFLNAAYRLPWWHVLFLSYNGYVSIYPSAVAIVAAAGPVKLAAIVMALGGGVATACAVFITVMASADHVASVILRLLLGVSVATFPLAGSEIAANSCNAQWYLLVATFWCLLWRPRNAGAQLLVLVVPFVSAGTDPLTGLLLPLAVLRFLAGPRRGRQMLLANLPTVGVLVGLLLQATTLLQPSLRPVDHHPAILELVGTWFYRGPQLALLGPGLAQRSGWLGFAITGAALALALALAFRGGHGPLAVLSLAMSALLFMVPSYIRGLSSGGLFGSFGIQTRYSFTPWALSLVVFILGAGSLLRSHRSSWRAPAVLLTLAVVVLVPATLGAHSGRSRSPSWIHEVRAQHTRCEAALRRGNDARATASLVVAPRASYIVHVPCRRLTGR